MNGYTTYTDTTESKKESLLTGVKIAAIAIVMVTVMFLIFRPQEVKEFYSTIFNAITSVSTTEAYASENNDWSIASNHDTLKCLKPEIWNELSYQDKFYVMYVIKNIEMYYFGISPDSYPKLVSEDLPGDIQGQCCYDSGEIVIDSSHLAYDSVESVLATICHEARHWYQYTCRDLYEQTESEYQNLKIFNTTKEYINNFNNYVHVENSDDENYYDYYNQKVEVDARDYAQDTVEDYYNIIERNGL